MLVRLSLKAAKDGDTSPLPAVLDRRWRSRCRRESDDARAQALPLHERHGGGGAYEAERTAYDPRLADLLPLIFAGLMGLAILVYVVLDGFDLGIGILFAAADDHEKDVMIAAIGPFWDANETWLVLAVGLLLVAFPGRARRHPHRALPSGGAAAASA